MANFGPINSVPEKYSNRQLYEWNPNVTLMRTNVEENRTMGKIFAEKANASLGPVAFLLPTRGVSIVYSDGDQYLLPEADRSMFDAIKGNLNPRIEVVELDANINDAAFAETAVDMLFGLMPPSRV